MWAQNESEVSCDSLSKTRALTAQDSILENQLRAIHLPLIIITTNDRVEPPYTVMEPPQGSTGLTITKNSAYGSIWVFFEGFSKAWPNCIILAFKLLTRLIMNNFVAKNF